MDQTVVHQYVHTHMRTHTFTTIANKISKPLHYRLARSVLKIKHLEPVKRLIRNMIFTSLEV